MTRASKSAADHLVRIGLALEASLLARFDAWLGARGAANRSEAVRDLLRERLLAADLSDEAEVVATVSIVYDHHHRVLGKRLTDLQHEHGDGVVSALHVHLDHDRCLEVIVLRGRAHAVRAFADRLIGEKGVVHGATFVTPRPPAATGGGAPHEHPHHDAGAHAHPHRSSSRRHRRAASR